MSSPGVKFASSSSSSLSLAPGDDVRQMKARFKKAVKLMAACSNDPAIQPTEQEKLKFYGLYKQAQNGPCNEPRPPFWDILRIAKWEEWDALKKMPREEAMARYISRMQKMLKRYESTSETAKLIFTTLMEPGSEIPASLTVQKPVLQAKKPLDVSIASEPSPMLDTSTSTSLSTTTTPLQASTPDLQRGLGLESPVADDLVMVENPLFSQSLDGLKSEYVESLSSGDSPVNETSQNPPAATATATPAAVPVQDLAATKENVVSPSEDLQKSKSFFVSDDDLLGNVADDASKLASGAAELESAVQQLSKKVKDLEIQAKAPSMIARLRNTWIFLIPLLAYIFRRYIVKSIMA